MMQDLSCTAPGSSSMMLNTSFGASSGYAPTGLGMQAMMIPASGHPHSPQNMTPPARGFMPMVDNMTVAPSGGSQMMPNGSMASAGYIIAGQHMGYSPSMQRSAGYPPLQGPAAGYPPSPMQGMTAPTAGSSLAMQGMGAPAAGNPPMMQGMNVMPQGCSPMQQGSAPGASCSGVAWNRFEHGGESAASPISATTTSPGFSTGTGPTTPMFFPFAAAPPPTPAALPGYGGCGGPERAELAEVIAHQREAGRVDETFASAGSRGHDEGLCKPCAFVGSEAGCRFGVDCRFCHVRAEHVKAARMRPCKGKRQRIKRQIARIEEAVAADPELLVNGGLELPSLVIQNAKARARVMAALAKVPANAVLEGSSAHSLSV
mmetsp:Transcript_63431/g.182591  ORF Transcript_63431/g.182591 Transcript_63431/m.182591 type:complete len:374 (+) Transcript_63431:141-1262(+)